MTEGDAAPGDRGMGKLHVHRRGAETRSFKRFVGGPGFRAFVGLARRECRGNGGSLRILEVNQGAFQTREEMGEALVADFMAAGWPTREEVLRSCRGAEKRRVPAQYCSVRE